MNYNWKLKGVNVYDGEGCLKYIMICFNEGLYGVFLGQNLHVIFSSLSLEYLSWLHGESLNVDASSSAGRARNSCEFEEKDTAQKQESCL